MPRPGADLPCENYRPTFYEFTPSSRWSAELLRMRRDDWRSADQRRQPDIVFVPQSEGRASAQLPLVSVKVSHCSICLLKNRKTGRALMVHHDSGIRGHWSDEAIDLAGGPPVSPCTPSRGLLGRDRCGLDEFLSEPGDKELLIVEGPMVYDRREVPEKFRALGVEVLPPLRLGNRVWSEDEEDDAGFNVAYHPLSDTLRVHYIDGPASRVLHFEHIFGCPVRVAGAARPPSLPDIVDTLDTYLPLLSGPAAISPRLRDLLVYCRIVIEARNCNPDIARQAVAAIAQLGGIPAWILDLLKKDDILSRPSQVLRGLHELVEHVCKSESAGAGSSR